jgi:hypothetical protein
MRHKKILDVYTIIYKGRQRVGFKVEGMDKHIFLSPGNVKQCTNIELIEVEILIGSTLRPELYKVGEEMINGQICKSGYPIIKDFWIECKDSIENMRKLNADKLKNFKEIQKVFTFNRNDKNIVGLDIDEEKAVFVQANRITNLTKLDLSEIHILEGSFIAPEYYKEGENIYEGIDHKPEIFRKSGVILKELNLRLFGKVEEMHERFENSEPSYSTGYYESYGNYNSGYDSNNWLADAAGSDDPEVMSIAYWNMD